MTYENFKNELFDISKKLGLDACEINYEGEKEFNLSLANGELDSYKDAESFKVKVVVLKNGKSGAAFTEILENPEKIINEAVENMEIVESEEIVNLHDGSGEYLNAELYKGNFEKEDVSDKLKFIKNIYDAAKSDPRIKMVPNIVYQNFVSDIRIANTYGLDKKSKSDGGFCYSMTVAEDVSPRSGFYYEVGKSPENLTLAIGEKAKEDAIAKIGSKSVKSGKYNIIINNMAFSDILGLLNSMISAENVQKEISPLKGKIGQKIGSDILTIKDIAIYPGSLTNRTFDREGFPTSDKTIIENGVLKTFLYDIKAALKENKKSTGNSTQGGIAPVNMVIEPGKLSFEELVKELGNGIIITEVEGMHSGANPVSGEFSLGAKGLLVENGEITKGVEQITLSDNFIVMLSKIKAIGNDTLLSYSNIITPSVIIENVDIAGNE